MALAESMGYYNELEFKYIPHVKSLFLPSDCRHIQWSHRPLEDYPSDKHGREITLDELKTIAAGPKERPISRRRKRKLSKQGKTVYWSKHLEQYVYVMEDKA
nr:hypothetical protein [Acinetobacter dispersus]